MPPSHTEALLMRLTIASLRRVVKARSAIEFVPQQLTSYGGLELLRRYFGLLGLHRRFVRRSPGCPVTTAARASPWCCSPCSTPGPAGWSISASCAATPCSCASAAWPGCRPAAPWRVGSRTGAVPVGSPWLCPPFPASCPCRFAMSPSPAPAASNGANGFPVRRFPAGFASRVMRTYRPASAFRRGPHTVPGTPERARAPHTPTPYSTSSSRSLDDVSPPSDGVAPSSPPRPGRR